MDSIGVFTPDQARELWQDYQSRKQLNPQIRQNFPIRRLIDEPGQHRVKVKNTSDEVIPPYACLRITGVEVVNEQTCLKVEKPSSTEGEFVFNGPYEIEVAVEAAEGVTAVNGVGWAYRYGIVVARGNGTPPTAANVKYKPIVDSWEIEEGDGFFTVFGEHNVVENAVIGRFDGGTALIPGIVRSMRTCNPGYYTVQLADWNASWVNYDPEDPNPCPTYTVTGEGTTACAITINQPSLQVTGRVDGAAAQITVLAYDCQSTVVPLKMDTMVLLKNLGHTVVIGEGEEAVTTPVWQIVRGRQVEAVYYEDTYDCCDGEGESGVETLISRVPSVLVGFRLPEITCGSCEV